MTGVYDKRWMGITALVRFHSRLLAGWIPRRFGGLTHLGWVWSAWAERVSIIRDAVKIGDLPNFDVGSAGRFQERHPGIRILVGDLDETPLRAQDP